ncbi:ABC transporter substrate-binding protein [Devosia pacifica]|uniref:ABC transporter substrate-binding protein n=1 Tax=Devosia pacifica TaxID=1335967 RepID=A0A918S5I1_9HYPH|nr:ABC transporter substrate-binding protein [Devosia pacifica]GHA25600.1 ABC transporter substrate-binding protein [Devosia pacifica]
MTSKLQSTLAISAFALLASATSASAQVTVEFWHSFGGSSGEALAQIIENFEAANPDITIEAEHVGNYEDIVTQLQAAIPAGREPDAVIMEVTRYGLFAERGILTDLTAYLEADPLRDELYDFAREIGVYNGKNYIIPFNSSTPVVYYNKDIFDRAGFAEEPSLETFDDILAAAQQITDELGDEGVFGIAAPGQFARWGLVMSNDSNLIDPQSGEVLLDAPNTIEAYEWMASLVHEHEVASVDNVTDEDTGGDAFLAGRVGINFASTGNYGSAREALGENLVVRPMPCNKVCSVPIGGAGIGILESADQDVKDAAYQFMSFAANPESNAIWFSATGYMPINRSTAEQPLAADALESKPGIDVAINQLDFAQGRPRPPVVTWMRSSEYDLWQAMALGQRTVEDTLTEFAARTRDEADRLAR